MEGEGRKAESTDIEAIEETYHVQVPAGLPSVFQPTHLEYLDHWVLHYLLIGREDRQGTNIYVHKNTNMVNLAEEPYSRSQHFHPYRWKRLLTSRAIANQRDLVNPLNWQPTLLTSRSSSAWPVGRVGNPLQTGAAE